MVTLRYLLLGYFDSVRTLGQAPFGFALDQFRLHFRRSLGELIFSIAKSGFLLGIKIGDFQEFVPLKY